MSGRMRVKDLGIERGGRRLFAGLGFELPAAQIVVVLGPNGAGKSSLLLALLGLVPHAGDIELQGKPLHEYSRAEIARRMAWQGELPPAEFGLTVEQRLRLAAGAEGAALAPAAAAMDVEDLLGRTLGELSAGERQRVELAALMLRDTPLWLLDEPTVHLDLRHQAACLAMLRRQASRGRSILVVLHDLRQAVSIADGVVLLDGRGNAVAGKADALLTRERLQDVFQVRLDANLFHITGDE
jgi:ABC-type cobalamin/Fe3+-siderophores transport systems, ATPase components